MFVQTTRRGVFWAFALILLLFFSGKTGALRASETPDWCVTHLVPESQCTLCSPDLVDAYIEKGDWCAEHELPESVCPICGGGPVIEKYAGWCAGHEIAEAQCTACHPELIPLFQAHGDWCAEHELPESACPYCGAGENRPDLKSRFSAALIRFKSPELERAVGMAFAPVTRMAMSEREHFPGRIDFNENYVAEVSSPYHGRVMEIFATKGEWIEAGDPLFTLSSTEVGELQGELAAARAQAARYENDYKRHRTLHDEGVVTESDLQAHEQAWHGARARVQALANSLAITGSGDGDQAGRFTLRAPLSGILTERSVRIGGMASSEQILAQIADPRQWWVSIEVPESRIDAFSVGDTVELFTDGAPQTPVFATVEWVAPLVDPQTRSVHVRASLEHDGGLLRRNQFVRVVTRGVFDDGSLVVPRSALQRVEGSWLVFVRREPGLYKPVPVAKGPASSGFVAVEGDLNLESTVVTEGAFFLKTELVKESIGSGCCEFETPEAP